MRISDWSSDVCSSDLYLNGSPMSPSSGQRWFSMCRRMWKTILAPRFAHCGWTQGRRREPFHKNEQSGDEMNKVLSVPAALIMDSLQIGRSTCRERVCQSVSIMEEA